MFRWLKLFRTHKLSLSEDEFETLSRENEESTNHAMPSTVSEINFRSVGGLSATRSCDISQLGLGGIALENLMNRRPRIDDSNSGKNV